MPNNENENFTSNGAEYLPAAQIRLELLRSEVNLRREQMESNKQINERMVNIETSVTNVRSDLLALSFRLDKSDKNDEEIKELVNRAIGGHDEILKKFQDLELVQHEIEEETEDGRKVIKKVSAWRQTAKDFHLEKLGKWAVGLLGASLAGRFAGFMFGQQIKAELLHLLFGK